MTGSGEDRVNRLLAAHRRAFDRVRGAGAEPEASHGGIGQRLGDAGVDDHELGARRTREHADGRAARDEVRDHLAGHLLRIRTHALRGDAVIRRRDDDRAAQRIRPERPPDRGDLRGEHLEPSEAAPGLRLAVELRDRRRAQRLVHGLEGGERAELGVRLTHRSLRRRAR